MKTMTVASEEVSQHRWGVVPGMDQGGVSWFLLDVCKKTIEHQRGWRLFPLWKTKKNYIYKYDNTNTIRRKFSDFPY